MCLYKESWYWQHLASIVAAESCIVAAITKMKRKKGFADSTDE